MERSTMNRGRWYLAAFLCATAFLLSGGIVLWDVARSVRERLAWEEISGRVQRERLLIEEKGGEAGLSEKYAPSGNLLVYDGLWQENHDMAGWLSIEGLGIELPVMYTPMEQEYYLHRSFSGEYAHGGSLFLGEGWDFESHYAVIYGHNMKDGSMFGKLDRYQEPEYAKEHPSIRFDILTMEQEYTVFAAFYSQAQEASQDAGFRYWQCGNITDRESFEEYLGQVRKRALYDMGADVRYGDSLLILTTCSYHREEGRFVVAAYRKQNTCT